MQNSGNLNNRVRFERQVPGADDSYGNPLPATWTELATVWAAFRPKFGREQLEAGGLESTMTGALTVRRSAAVAAVTAADRVVFTAGPYADRTCQIRSIVPTMDNSGIEFLLEEGVAT